MRSISYAVTFAVVSGLSGCATMDEDECRTADWRTIGYEDGVAGYAGDRIGEHREACAEHGVAPDLAAYLSGRDEGLREYCRPQNGFRVGSSGDGYSGSCPADLESEFMAAYDSGRHLHTLQSRVSNAHNQLDSKRRDLNKTEDDIVKNSALAIASDATAEERAAAIIDVKQLAERVGRLKSEIRQLERDCVVYERDLEDYRAGLGDGI